MTRGTIRALLRRRIDDPEPEVAGDTQWSNAELDSIINTAAADIQAAIKAVDPEAFIRVTRSNIVADEPLVPKPQAAGAILDVKMLSAGRYSSLGAPIRYDQVSLYPTSGTQQRYAMLGRWIYLAPTPSTSVSNGLEWWFSETVEIATGTADDDRVFPFDVALHDAIVYKSQIILGPEDGATDPAVLGLYTDSLAKIPLYYRRTLNQPTPLQPDIYKRGQDDRLALVNPGGRNWSM